MSGSRTFAQEGQHRQRVARCQRTVSKRKKGGTRRRKAVKTLARAHRRVQRVRRDWHQQVALKLVRKYEMIAVEDLNVKGMARGMFARSVNDVAWGQFLQILADKAASAGRTMIMVDLAARVRNAVRVADHPRCRIRSVSGGIAVRVDTRHTEMRMRRATSSSADLRCGSRICRESRPHRTPVSRVGQVRQRAVRLSKRLRRPENPPALAAGSVKCVLFRAQAALGAIF